MRKRLLAAAAATALTALPVQARDGHGDHGKAYDLDLTHASIVWRVSHAGGLSKYTGRFTDFDADLVFDVEKPDEAALTVTIDPTSVETNYSDSVRAMTVRSGEEFDAGKVKDFDGEIASKVFKSGDHPEITFTATEIDITGEETGTVTGDLNFVGVSLPVTLDVSFNGSTTFPWAPETEVIGFSASTTLTRSDFGADQWISLGVGDQVEILIEAEFKQAAE